jgi:hypothetical protein
MSVNQRGPDTSNPCQSSAANLENGRRKPASIHAEPSMTPEKSGVVK